MYLYEYMSFLAPRMILINVNGPSCSSFSTLPPQNFQAPGNSSALYFLDGFDCIGRYGCTSFPRTTRRDCKELVSVEFPFIHFHQPPVSRMAAKMFSLASCGRSFSILCVYEKMPTSQEVMLFYDIVITFGQEVEHIWMRKFSLITILWALVRLSFFFQFS